jgi:hypothetical protein
MNTTSSIPLLLLFSLVAAGCSGTTRSYIYQINRNDGDYKCMVRQKGTGDFANENCVIKDRLVIIDGHEYTIPDDTMVTSIRINIDEASGSGEAELKFCLTPTKGKDCEEHEHVIHKLTIKKPQ